MKTFWKVLGVILKWLTIIVGVLFTICMLHLGLNLVGWG